MIKVSVSSSECNLNVYVVRVPSLNIRVEVLAKDERDAIHVWRKANRHIQMEQGCSVHVDKK